MSYKWAKLFWTIISLSELFELILVALKFKVIESINLSGIPTEINFIKSLLGSI